MAKRRGRSFILPPKRGAGSSNFDGRLAYDIVEAATVIKIIKRIDNYRKEEKRHKAKVANVTLAIAPWEKNK